MFSNQIPRWPSQQPIQWQQPPPSNEQIEVRPASDPLLINALIQVNLIFKKKLFLIGFCS